MRAILSLAVLVFLAGPAYAGSCAGAGNLTTQCPAGQMLSGFQNGSPLCIAPPNSMAGVTCAAGEVLNGFNPDGTPKCDPAASGVAPITCPPGQSVTSVNASGTLVCAPSGGNCTHHTLPSGPTGDSFCASLGKICVNAQYLGQGIMECGYNIQGMRTTCC